MLKPEDPGWWWFVLECIRCHTRRYDLITSNAKLWSRRYKYPNGYQVDEKITRGDMRREWAQRHHYETITAKRTKRKEYNS